MLINPSKNLVICAVGDESLHKNWIPKRKDNYDLFLIYYGDNEGYENDSKCYIREKGPKFHLVKKIIEENPKIYKYDYIWIPDDDIYLDRTDVIILFDLCQEYELHLAQPSIIGWYGIGMTLHNKDTSIRYTNYVEIMCPCFSSSALRKCLYTFNLNKTGWGIDSLWNVVLGSPTDKIAIIDDVVAVHTRPVGGGDVYKNQVGGDRSKAMEEAEKIYHDNDLGKSSYGDLSNGKLVSQESFHMNYFNLVEYSRVYRQREAGVDVADRLWPNNQAVKEMCEALRK